MSNNPDMTMTGDEVSPKKLGLWQKILAVQTALGTVKRDKTASFGGRNDSYAYASEEAILSLIKTEANLFGLIVIIDKVEAKHGVHQSTTAQGVQRVTRFASVEVTYRVIDADSGESTTAIFPGYGENTGDKAVYIAMTGANKYFWLKFFGVPTGDDPEAQAPSDPHRPDAASVASGSTVPANDFNF